MRSRRNPRIGLRRPAAALAHYGRGDRRSTGSRSGAPLPRPQGLHSLVGVRIPLDPPAASDTEKRPFRGCAAAAHAAHDDGPIGQAPAVARRRGTPLRLGPPASFPPLPPPANPRQHLAWAPPRRQVEHSPHGAHLRAVRNSPSRHRQRRASLIIAGQLRGGIGVEARLHDRIEFAGQHSVEVVSLVAGAVVGDAVLGEVVSADAL